MQKKRVFKSQPPESVVEELCQCLQVDKLVATHLARQGVRNFDEAKLYFRPSLEDLHDPFLMKDMDKAIARIDLALKQEEKILVYGDYDVDGTTSVALVYTFIKKIHTEVDYYIPDRYTEGYGISFQGIDWAKANGFSLIIALDCGIKSVEKIEHANQLGIDFIICDHHLPGEQLPEAKAILDPKRNDCTYPYKELSGCGIGLKLLEAFLISKNRSNVELAPYLDLVAVSIASDLVAVTGENRILASLGLRQLNANPRPGFKAIMNLNANQNKTELTLSDLGYVIGPRINAAGRLENGRKAVSLLISENKVDATLAGELINITNEARKDLDSKITEEAFQLIEKAPEVVNEYSNVLYNPTWHKGVVGIVASRLVERYYKPTIVLTEANGSATGSARSVKNFDVYEAIAACSELLEQFGGHKYAAGLTLKMENIDAFKEKFNRIVSESIDKDALMPEIEIDATIELKDITPKLIRLLKQLEPFGMNNPTPVFVSHHLKDTGGVYIVGKNHLRFEVMDPSNDSVRFQAIAFGQAEYFRDIHAGKSFSICYTIEENQWKGVTTPQLNVKDIVIHS